MKSHKEMMLEEINSLFDPNFQIPEGLYIPVGNDLLIKECPQPEFKTKSGLIMPKTDRLQHTSLGIVYRVGEGVNKPIKVGMTVAFIKQSNIAVAHDGEAYLVVDEFAIKAVVPPANYFAPHVAGTEEKRRESMISAQEGVAKSVEKEIDKLNNS